MKSHWRKAEGIFHSALEQPIANRTAFVKDACGGDVELQREVESLLADASAASQFLDGTAIEVVARIMSTDPDTMIGRQIGTYRIVSLLGAGGMGEVYLATDMSLKRSVAIKVLPELVAADRDRLARLQREAEILASMNHPNIATIFGLERSAGTTALVMEFVEGPTLADRLGKGPISPDEALSIAKQISEALEAAHEQGIIHRDLKPANIKVREDGTVKVLDFGLAKSVASGALSTESQAPTTADRAVTGVGVVLGTPAYMSPEQARGRPVDKRSDVWAFGCVLYELLTGRRAFSGDTDSDVLASVLTREPDWTLVPAGLSPVLNICLKRCLRKNRRERIGDAQSMRLAVEGAFEIAVLPRQTPLVTHLQMDVGPADSLASSLSRPRSVGFRPARTAFALSPDGRLVVFAGTNGTVVQLYRRELDQAEARPVSGTKGASEPFFSPDGEWIGFQAHNKLKKVRAVGGPPTTICDLPPTGRGAGKSWGEDGTILFAGPVGISMVSSAGGTPAIVTTPNAGERDVLPQFLPGGRVLLFTNVPADTAADWETSKVVVQALDTGERHVLIPGGADCRYINTGHLVYMKTGTLMAVPFDARSLQGTGPAVALIEDVMQSVNAPSGDDETGAGQFAVSAAGTLLYVTGGINPMMQRSLVWVDRAGTAKSMAAPAGLYTGQRISPDGERIAMFANRGATRTNDLWIYDLVRGAPTRLTVDANNTWPVWSPDGKRLVYASNISGVSNLYAINADGSGRPERLTTSDCMQLPSSWASVANAVAFLQRRQLDGNFEIWVLPMTGDKKARLFLESRFNLMWPDLSPDGQWMAYVSNESGDNEVYVQPYPGPGEKIRLSTSGGTQPIWTTNGLELLYRSGTLENQQVFSMKIRSLSPFRADAPRLLFEAKARDYGNTSPIRGWDMTPDGQRFLFVRSNAPGNKPLSTVQVVLNWFEELKQRVPSAR